MFIDSERLYLREIRKEEDLPLLFDLHSDPEVMKFIRPAEKTIEETKQTMQRIMNTNDYSNGKGLWICHEKNSGEFIGWFVLKELDGTKDTELGYRLLKSKWGFGYATEMTLELLKHCFQKLQLQKVAAATHPDNKPSQHVLEKAGFKFTRRQMIGNIDACIYEILNRK